MNSLLSYPPTPEQLEILKLLGSNSAVGLLMLRLMTLVVFGTALWLTVRFWKKELGGMVAAVTGILILISPTAWVLINSYPVRVVEWWLMAVGFVWGRKNKLIYVVMVAIVAINLFWLKQRPAILNKLSLGDAVVEVNNRFMSEDSLNTKIDMPLWWRRLGNNKLFFVYKQIWGEVIPYFDVETWFFQEVHPMEQKSVVMFFWPEAILLLLGVGELMRNSSRSKGGAIIQGAVVAGVVFVFSEGAVYQRLWLSMWWLAPVVASGLIGLGKFFRVGGVMAGLLLVYAAVTNFYDLNKRPDFWLDNRPLAFEYWFGEISQLDYRGKIVVTNRIGNSEDYCRYFLGKSCDGRFEFRSFEWSEDNDQIGLYAGFTGEYVGKRFKNDFESNWEDRLSGMGARLVAKKNLRDTVAYQFGNDIGLVIKQ